MRRDHDSTLPPRWQLPTDSDSYTFTGSASVTVTIRGTEYCTLSVTLPGAQPFSIVCSQSYALSRALTEALAKPRAGVGGEAGGSEARIPDGNPKVE